MHYIIENIVFDKKEIFILMSYLFWLLLKNLFLLTQQTFVLYQIYKFENVKNILFNT